ncbi:ecotropic viral integration site 5 protein [Enteropsectra breve]|nr:ecotropic viral integration site 5 protein [Enteropsectra breve]
MEEADENIQEPNKHENTKTKIIQPGLNFSAPSILVGLQKINSHPENESSIGPSDTTPKIHTSSEDKSAKNPDVSQTSIRKLYSCDEDIKNMVCTDAYGFLSEGYMGRGNYEESFKPQWNRVLACSKESPRKLREAMKREKMLERGIPLSLKSKIWKLLLQRGGAVSKARRIISDCETNAINYERLKALALCDYDFQIHADVQRTFRHHFLFLKKYGTGQCELFNILVAIASYDRRVGYCQGMSEICGLLLMYFKEREAFMMYLALSARDRLDELFDGSLKKLNSMMKIQNRLFKLFIPEIDACFTKEGVDFTMYAVGWYMTLFTRFKISLVLRVWDFYVFYNINVLVYFTAAILKYHEESLLGLTGEKLFNFLRRMPDEDADEDLIVSIAAKYLKETDKRYL